MGTNFKESFLEKGLCTLEDLDLNQPLILLESLIDDRGKLWQLVQKLIPTEELFQLLPKVLKVRETFLAKILILSYELLYSRTNRWITLRMRFMK